MLVILFSPFSIKISSVLKNCGVLRFVRMMPVDLLAMNSDIDLYCNLLQSLQIKAMQIWFVA